MPRSLKPDKQLLIVTLTLCFIGAVMVFSASAMTAQDKFGAGYIFLLRQFVYIVLGIAGMFAMMNTDYRKLRQPRIVFTGLALTFICLVGVYFLDRSHATHRWFRLGPFSFQPSEMAKLALIIFLAWFLESRRAPGKLGINDFWGTLAPALGTVLAMAALVVKEPDMGTAFMIVVIGMVMLYVAGLSYKYIGGAVAGRHSHQYIYSSSACRTAWRASKPSSIPTATRRALAFSCCNRSSPLAPAA